MWPSTNGANECEASHLCANRGLNSLVSSTELELVGIYKFEMSQPLENIKIATMENPISIAKFRS